MAEAASGTRSNNLCRYFANGVCRFGSNCRFSHDRSNAVTDNTCRYYLAGNCSYGSNCRYDHVRPRDRPVAVPVVNLSRPVTDVASGARSKNSWANAREFVPASHQRNSMDQNWNSYSQALHGVKTMDIRDELDPVVHGELCPFYMQGECPYRGSCQYVHGNECELCGLPCLHPTDSEQRRKHNAECMKVLEEDMKLSFAISRSDDKACGICMDKVTEKPNLKDRQFGILTGCNHVFCLTCIREWRSRKEYKQKVVRACPECRVHSDFIVPSSFWFEDEKEKQKMITEYKERLAKRDCKYFNQGKGTCPFASACFYRHAYPDGTIATNEEPPRPRRRVRTAANTLRAIQQSLLWDFFEGRESGDDFTGVFELDEDAIINLLSAVDYMDSDSASSYGDAYSDYGDSFDSDSDSEFDDFESRIRFALNS